ncbi:ankyrin repeat-containing protein [Rubidibacter lacunae KORDI 51-2]|uniref:Ankyrin repeat-containing protein n=1 Tax=Rubidibacter lacunae KORDI 51-2 TaxID=582515 RepID=U5DLK8_9CHRO|nr:ankyrin repeat domain-containing protein [Rubidibacter lacunae]ERN41464.1 ankyrin repeat-containing protein [Rubidibacter lacunae KORDI 51-2]
MGATFVNHHVRSDRREPVEQAVQTLSEAGAYLSTARQGWVSIFDQAVEEQFDESGVEQFTRQLSAQLESIAIGVVVSDSDSILLWIYGRDRQQLHYVLEPSHKSHDSKALCTALQHCSSTGASFEDFAAVCRRQYEFAEDCWGDLAELLGIPRAFADLDYTSIADGEFDEVGLVASDLLAVGEIESSGGRALPAGLSSVGEQYLLAVQQQRGLSPAPGGQLPNESPLVEAVRSGNVARVRSQLAAGANVETTNWEQSATLLAIAAGEGHLELVDLLLASGAQINFEYDPWSLQPQRPLASPLECAARGGHEAIVARLLAAGAELGAGRSALYAAVVGDCAPLVRMLLAAGADPNGDDPKMPLGMGMTLLMSAAQLGAVEVAIALLEAGADPNRRDEEGWTARCHAQRYGQVQSCNCWTGTLKLHPSGNLMRQELTRN